MEKEYLGDAVYVGIENSGILLTTESGENATNIIYLSTEVLKALLDYLSRANLS